MKGIGPQDLPRWTLDTLCPCPVCEAAAGTPCRPLAGDLGRLPAQVHPSRAERSRAWDALQRMGCPPPRRSSSPVERYCSYCRGYTMQSWLGVFVCPVCGLRS